MDAFYLMQMNARLAKLEDENLKLKAEYEALRWLVLRLADSELKELLGKVSK
jgi:hypothetical protein